MICFCVADIRLLSCFCKRTGLYQYKITLNGIKIVVSEMHIGLSTQRSLVFFRSKLVVFGKQSGEMTQVSKAQLVANLRDG